MANNRNPKAAKKAKNDEFYTRLEDIEAEISCHQDYVRHFKDKVVFCNCDDPEQSNFFWFFRLHFKQLGLKKLITTHYTKDGSPSYKIEWEGEMLGDDTINMITTPLEGDGDFRSEECVEILKEADIVVTNPPFSLFRIYVSLLMEYEKKFIIIGNKNAITYKEFFPLLKDNKVWIGYSNPQYFLDDKGNPLKQVSGLTRWFTNLDIDKRHEDLPLTKNYHGNEEKYPKYDNYDAINVDKVRDIPKDYFGNIGVPITYLDGHNPEQFEIIELGNSGENFTPNKDYINPKKHTKDGKILNGGAINCVLAIETQKVPVNQVYYTSDNSKYLIPPYARILIRKLRQSKKEQ